MIIRSKAPLRLGLAGGGSDVSPYSDIYGGLVLNATINLYTYCTIEEIAEDEIVINSYDASCFKNYHLSESLEIDGEAFLIKGVYNRIIRDYHSQLKGFRITTYNDAPIGSGLGTSSSMVVCILKAFIEWLSLPLGDYETSRLAYEIERKDLGLSGGKQDQYAAAFGGFNYMEFLKEDLVIVNPLKIKRWIVDELEASIVLYFTGASRSSAKIINEQKENTSKGWQQYKHIIDGNHKPRQSSRSHGNKIILGVTFPPCLIKNEFTAYINHYKTKAYIEQYIRYGFNSSIAIPCHHRQELRNDEPQHQEARKRQNFSHIYSCLFLKSDCQGKLCRQKAITWCIKN